MASGGGDTHSGAGARGTEVLDGRAGRSECPPWAPRGGSSVFSASGGSRSAASPLPAVLVTPGRGAVTTEPRGEEDTVHLQPRVYPPGGDLSAGRSPDSALSRATRLRGVPTPPCPARPSGRTRSQRVPLPPTTPRRGAQAPRGGFTPRAAAASHPPGRDGRLRACRRGSAPALSAEPGVKALRPFLPSPSPSSCPRAL